MLLLLFYRLLMGPLLINPSHPDWPGISAILILGWRTDFKMATLPIRTAPTCKDRTPILRLKYQIRQSNIHPDLNLLILVPERPPQLALVTSNQKAFKINMDIVLVTPVQTILN